jgi:hypothetical protein
MASVCTSMNSASTFTSPITEKSMKGCTPFTGGVTNRLTVMVMKKTSANVPMNSATNAAGPLSATSDMDGSSLRTAGSGASVVAAPVTIATA